MACGAVAVVCVAQDVYVVYVAVPKARRAKQPLPQAEIDFVVLADSAQVVQQKLYLLGGGWNQLSAGAYPANHPMAIAVGVLVPWALTDETHAITVDMVDEDGNPIAQTITAELKVGRPPNLKRGSTQRAMFSIQGIIGIPRAGSYTVRARVGEAVRSTSFDALVVPGMPVLPAPPTTPPSP